MTTRNKTQRAVKRSLPAVARQEQAQATVEEAADKPERQQRGVVRDKVLKYIEKASGTTVYADDMAKDLGLNQAQIRAAARGLIDSGNCPQLVVTIAGRAWRWDASQKAAKQAKRIFEELTTTKAGVVLVQDEDGNVYKLEEL